MPNHQLRLENFIQEIKNMSPGDRGNKTQDYIIQDNGLNKLNKNLGRGDCSTKNKKYLEIKTSFLGDENKYNICNITTGSDYDWFLLCFVDKNDKPNFYCVDKDRILKNPLFKLTNMHKDTYNLLRTSIKESNVKSILDRHNHLNGDTYSHLQKFMKKQNRLN